MSNPIEIKCWRELVSFLQDLRPVDMACRGQERDYKDGNGPVMKARIDRCLILNDLGERLRMERGVCQRFREHAPVYLSDVERRYLVTRWLQLVVMQHYGAPTRLLDWTKSPWVAAFFAAFGGWEHDGYVYAFRRDLLEERIKDRLAAELPGLVWGPHPSHVFFSDDKWDLAKGNERLFDPASVRCLSHWVATYYCREAHFPRLAAQQGIFTFGSKPNLNHWRLIRDLLPNDNECFVAKIEADAKPDILRRLNGVGLNGATLFPGADGIGRSLEGHARAWHLGPRPSQF